MEKKLNRLCDKHGLSSISVMLIPGNGPCHLTVYVHWHALELSKCASGSGATFDRALAVALDEMAQAQIRTAAA